MKNILIVNSGSATTKYKVFEKSGKILDEKNFSLKEKKAENNFLKNLKNIEKIGFRVVHGGVLSKTSKIDKKVLDQIKKFLPYAPIHNQAFLEKFFQIEKIFLKKIKKYAVFDTHFHSEIEKENFILPIDQKIAEKNSLRRYGFHGISNSSVLKKFILKNKIKNLNKEKIIIVHLGGGSSVTAVSRGFSIYNSMGLTPLSGIMGKTRSGSIDPDIFAVLNLPKEKISEKLSFSSGFLGLTGSLDTKKIIEKAKKNKNSKENTAYTFYQKSIIKEILYCEYLLKGVDFIIFSGGIGFNNKYLLNDIKKQLNFLDIKKENFLKIDSNEEQEIFEQIKNL